MNSKNALIFVGILITLLFCIFFLGFFMGKFFSTRYITKQIKKERQDAVKRSRAVINGLVSEQIAPFFPDFPLTTDKLRFIGDPIDFIGFETNGTQTIQKISFIEVKSGKSRLSPIEKSLKQCIEQGNIEYIEYRIPE